MDPLGNNKNIILRFNGKTLALAAAVMLVLALSRRLWSEALTLVTSYPVPSGIYNQIVTTGNSGSSPADTILNRNAGNTILTPSSNAGGKVGIGTTAPAKKLDVAGDVKADSGRFTSGVQLGDDPVACDGVKAGALRWHGGKFEGCDGSIWKDLQGSASGDMLKCSDAGGAWVAGQSLCYFPGNSCPGGWNTSSYTSTVPQTCGPGGPTSSCTTGSHSHSTSAVEICAYNYEVCCNRGGYYYLRSARCNAIVSERGCTASP